MDVESCMKDEPECVCVGGNEERRNVCTLKFDTGQSFTFKGFSCQSIHCTALER